MRKCDSCGKLYQESKDVFCPHCGAVAQKQCTHGSSFDSKRYDRGEIYKNDTQYRSTTYNKNFEPHAQRKNTSYTQSQKSFENKKSFSDKVPTFNLPDLTKMLPNRKSGKNTSKPIGLVIFCVIIAFNLITGLLSTSEDDVFSSDYEVVSEEQADEKDLYTIVDEATIEMVDVDGNFKTFAIEISGMGFDDALSENMQNEILSGALAEEIFAEDTFVDMRICDFSKKSIDEESYNNALADCVYHTGERTGEVCKYKFTYSFDYDDIVHIADGVSFYLDNGLYINAELPFSAFSVSEDGEITYYTSYADSETEWNTIFSECSNQQDINSNLCIDFEAD